MKKKSSKKETENIIINNDNLLKSIKFSKKESPTREDSSNRIEPIKSEHPSEKNDDRPKGLKLSLLSLMNIKRKKFTINNTMFKNLDTQEENKPE